MGKGASKVSQDLEHLDGDGTTTITRAIARGRVYVILRYPREVETLEDTSFSDDQFRELLGDIQKVGKAFSLASSAMGDLNKTIARGALTHQQLLFLQQRTLQQQQQQQQSATPSPISTPPPQQQQVQPSSSTSSSSLQPKLALPTGMEQLRATVALPLQQRFTTATSSSAPAVRGITAGGRTMQAEEVLALLRQQSLSLRMQHSRAAVAAQLHAVRDPSPAIAAPQLQFHADGASQLIKKPQATSTPAILQSDGVKLIQSASPAVTTDGIQLKVELVEQSQLQKAAQLLPKQTIVAAVQRPPSGVTKTAVQKQAPSGEAPLAEGGTAGEQASQSAGVKATPTTTATSS